MIALSKSARRSLDDYLRQARAYLRGSRSVDADEVEQNITEHIENALEGANEPVSCDQLEAVLQKLGDPQQWVPAEDLPWWRQFVLRLRTGPEDWRLAYISFALFVAGLALFPPASIVLILASYVVSQAALAEMGASDCTKGQKWLLYPSLILVNSFVAVCLLLWPLLLLGIAATEMEHGFRDLYHAFADDLHYWCIAWSVMIAGLGLWGAVFGGMLARWQKLQSLLLKPFGVSLKPKWIRTFRLSGLALMLLSACAGVLYFRYVI